MCAIVAPYEYDDGDMHKPGVNRHDYGVWCCRASQMQSISLHFQLWFWDQMRDTGMRHIMPSAIERLHARKAKRCRDAKSAIIYVYSRSMLDCLVRSVKLSQVVSQAFLYSFEVLRQTNSSWATPGMLRLVVYLWSQTYSTCDDSMVMITMFNVVSSGQCGCNSWVGRDIVPSMISVRKGTKR